MEFASFTGNVALSTDGFGSIPGVGVISASAPGGSSVVAAYLYSTTRERSTIIPSPVTLNGTAVEYTSVSFNSSIDPRVGGILSTSRADVTGIVAPIINGGGGVYDFDVDEGIERFAIEGHALVVVYENPTLPESSVGILDGFASVTGDTATINFAEPLDPSEPGFFAEMRLGIGHSGVSTPPQVTRITVNGFGLTGSAGGFDDGEPTATGTFPDGSLVTVGGFDDPFSPLLPTFGQDHERYDIASGLTPGDTSIRIDTINPDQSDNLFLAAFYVSGEIVPNAPPPGPEVPAVPLPASAVLLGSALAGSLGVAGLRRPRRA